MFQYDLRENNSQWKRQELRLIKNQYFELIKITDRYCELQSKNTKHFWILQRKHSIQQNYKICIYHKYSMKQPYYHKHWQTYSIKQAVESIIKHDKYCIEDE